MKKKLLHGILIGLGVVVMLWMAFPFGMIFSLAFWIYLGVMYRKRKRVFHEEMEPGLAKKLLKRLKILIIAAGISFTIAIVGIIMHNVQSRHSETEESLYFFIGIVALYLFILASGGGLFIFIKGRRKPI
jgi:hypothetical protein